MARRSPPVRRDAVGSALRTVRPRRQSRRGRGAPSLAEEGAASMVHGPGKWRGGGGSAVKLAPGPFQADPINLSIYLSIHLSISRICTAHFTQDRFTNFTQKALSHHRQQRTWRLMRYVIYDLEINVTPQCLCFLWLIHTQSVICHAHSVLTSALHSKMSCFKPGFSNSYEWLFSLKLLWMVNETLNFDKICAFYYLKPGLQWL